MIEEKFCSEVPAEYKQQYLQVLLKFHEAISEDRFNLGRCRTDLHEITLKTDEPIFVKQFKIPDAHMEEVEKHVIEWLKLGVIEPARSKYTSHLCGLDSTISFPNISFHHINESLQSDVGDARRVGNLSHG